MEHISESALLENSFLQKFDQKLSLKTEKPKNSKIQDFTLTNIFINFWKPAKFGHKTDKTRPQSYKKANFCANFHQISHFLPKIASKTHIFSNTQAKIFKNSAPKMQKLKNMKFYSYLIKRKGFQKSWFYKHLIGILV